MPAPVVASISKPAFFGQAKPVAVVHAGVQRSSPHPPLARSARNSRGSSSSDLPDCGAAAAATAGPRKSMLARRTAPAVRNEGIPPACSRSERTHSQFFRFVWRQDVRFHDVRAALGADAHARCLCKRGYRKTFCRNLGNRA